MDDKPTFKFLGGKLCLDFVDSCNWDDPDPTVERFKQYEDFVRWSLAAEVLIEAQTQRLLTQAQQSDSHTAFEYGLRLRALLHRVFAAVAHEQRPSDADFAALNRELSQAVPHLRITAESNGFSWAWATESNNLGQVFWPVIWSAGRLLTEGELARIKQCDGNSCGWIFFDTSRNRSRRWCEMAHCGNRAKARRHYRRHSK